MLSPQSLFILYRDILQFPIFFFFLFLDTWVLSDDAPIVTGGREGDNINFNCSMPEHSEEAADLKWFVNDKEVRILICHCHSFFQNFPLI